MFDVSGRLDTEGGVTFNRALDMVMGQPASGDQRTPRQRRADGVVEMARRVLSGAPGFGGDRTQLVVVAGLETLRKEPGAPPGQLDWRFPIPAETVRRLACDSARVAAVVDGEGNPLDVGRAVRTMPPPVRRALALKYRTCGFPGCHRPIEWCEGHHLKHWADGGATSAANGVPLCGFHHRLVHEGGWRLEPGPEGGLVAVPP